MRTQASRKVHRPKVLFNHRSTASSGTTRNDSNGNNNSNIAAHSTKIATRKKAVEHPAGNSQEQRESDSRSNATMASIPALFTSLPPVRDDLTTQTSESQDETVEVCLPFLSGKEKVGTRNAYGIPHLTRDRHIKFLQTQLGELPGAFKAMDPGRPWIFYWCLAALTLLGEDVVSYRERLIKTVRPMQNEGGGFAGGFGQDSHLATTYAIVLSLALVGGDDAFEVVDRKSMWRWLGSLKQPNGGFQMAVGGEEDVRGAYCAAVIISLLNIPLDLPTDSAAYSAGHTDLLSGLGEWISRCQTYEGGVSAKPGTEAHGAYAFCALGCLSILDSPHRAVPRYLNVPRLISWLSSRQNAPEGGFSGRTNKLVDGCYCHWVGGCWPLIQASLSGPQEGPKSENVNNDARAATSEEAGDLSLFSREGMIRYILCCCQDTSKRGGLRDKPSAYSDAYHTCYVLSGLSSVQHKWTLESARLDASLERIDEWSVKPFQEGGQQVFDEEDRVHTTHPVFVIPQQKVENILQYFSAKTGF